MQMAKKQPDWWSEAGRLYLDGLNMRQVAVRMGKSKAGVALAINRMGIKRDTPQRQLNIDWDYIRSLHENHNYSVSECAQEAGCSASYCGNKLREMGTKMRTREEATPAKSARKWINARKIKHAEIARRAGVDPTSVSHWLSGRNESESIERVLRDMGCPERLFELENRMSRTIEDAKPEKRTKQKYWNPWASGEIHAPQGVAATSTLMLGLG
jgi:AraC-like DNA-binding protein